MKSELHIKTLPVRRWSNYAMSQILPARVYGVAGTKGVPPLVAIRTSRSAVLHIECCKTRCVRYDIRHSIKLCRHTSHKQRSAAVHQSQLRHQLSWAPISEAVEAGWLQFRLPSCCDVSGLSFVERTGFCMTPILLRERFCWGFAQDSSEHSGIDCLGALLYLDSVT